MKYSVCLSEAICGSKSRSTLFTPAPRLTGSDQGSNTVLRVAVHRSELPSPPGRLEKKKTSSPSNRTDEPASLAVLLSSETGVASPNVPSGEAGTFFRLLGDQHVSDSLTLDGDDAASGYARAMEGAAQILTARAEQQHVPADHSFGGGADLAAGTGEAVLV